MIAVFRILLAPFIWAGGAVRTVLGPFYWIATSNRRISTWIGKPAAAFALRRIAMVFSVAALLALWLLTQSTQVETSPMIALNAELAMWQIGARLGPADLLAVLVMSLAVVVSLGRFAGDDLGRRLWVIVTVILATVLLALAKLPLIIPAALGLLGLAGSSTLTRAPTRVALVVPLIMSAVLLVLGLTILATAPVDPGLTVYLAPSESIAKLLMIGALLLSNFALPGMGARLEEDMETESGGRIVILIAVSIANGYIASVTTSLEGMPSSAVRLVFGLLLLVSLVQVLRRAWTSPVGSRLIGHYWTLSQLLLVATVVAGVTIPAEWYVLYGEIAGLSVLFLYCWSGHQGERANLPETTVGSLLIVTGWLTVLGAPSTAVFNVRWLMAAGLPSAEAESYLVWIAGLFLAGGGQAMVAGRVLRGESARADSLESHLQPDQTMIKVAAYAAAGLMVVWAILSVALQGAGSLDLSSTQSAALGIWAYLVTAAAFLLGLYLTLSAERRRDAKQVPSGAFNSALSSVLQFVDSLDIWGWTATILNYLANWIRWLLYITLLRPPEIRRTGGG